MKQYIDCLHVILSKPYIICIQKNNLTHFMLIISHYFAILIFILNNYSLFIYACHYNNVFT